MKSFQSFKIILKPDGLAFIVLYKKAFDNNRFILSTGERHPKKKAQDFWLTWAQTAYDSLINEGIPITNGTLRERILLIKDKITWTDDRKELRIWDGDQVNYFSIPESVDYEALKRQLTLELSKQRPDFRKIIDRFISDGKTGLLGFWKAVLDREILPRNGKPLRASSITSKRQTFDLIKEYKPSVNFESMDKSFYNGFTKWLADVKGFDRNNIAKHVKELKSELHLAYSNDLMSNDKFKYWPVPREKNEVVTLTKEEVLQIKDLSKMQFTRDDDGKLKQLDTPRNLTETEKNVRDLFIIACFTGVRIGDFKAFSTDNLSTTNGVAWLSYTQEKTGARVRIPIHPIVQEILNVRSGQFPKMIAEQNFRAYLKDICASALKDIGNPDHDRLKNTVVTKIRDGKEIKGLKYEVLSPHSARRTFATSLFYGWFGKPMPASFCMRFTGHKTEKSFMLYIGAKDRDLDTLALQYFDLQPIMKVS